jgi:GNAT superfamily N-acetyltransferase
MVNLNIATLDSDDAKLRFEIVEEALEVIEREGIEVRDYSDEELAAFVSEWQDLSGADTKAAKKLLTVENIRWLEQNYSYPRLLAFCNFVEYCEWLAPREIVQHYGDLLKLFLALRGPKPPWCLGVPYQRVLRVALSQVHSEYRTERIRQWLSEHWVEACRMFGDSTGAPTEDFPMLMGVTWGHVYTQYKRIRAEKTREYMREHPERVKEVRKCLGPGTSFR